MADTERSRIFERNPVAALAVAPFFYVLVLPIVLVVALVNELARLVVSCLLWYNYGGNIALVGEGTDAISNHKTEGTTRNILIFGTLKPGTYSSARAAEMFQEQVMDHERYESSGGEKGFVRPYDKLRKIMTTVYGYTCWKLDENFDVRNHFWDAKDDRVYTKEDVMKLLSAFAEDMDESKPQWEWIYIHRYQDETGVIRAGLIVRFHHAYMDGLSLLLMFSRQLCRGNTPLIFDPTKLRIPLKLTIMAHIYTILFAPGTILSELLNMATTHWVQNGPFPGGKKLYVSTPVIEREVLKQMRARTKASPPNIIFKSFIMAAQQVLPQERVLPIFRVGEVLPIIPYRTSDPQNTIGGCSYSIRTPTEEQVTNPADFIAGIEAIKKERCRAMMGPQPLFIYYSFRFCGRLPRFLLSASVRDAHYGIFLSNLPAFVEKMHFLGADLEELAAWPPMPNLTGITLCSITYGEDFKLTANVDPSWLTQEELNAIFDRIPKIMQSVADFGCLFSPRPAASSSGPRTLSKSYSMESEVYSPIVRGSFTFDPHEKQTNLRSRLPPHDVNRNENHKGLN